MSQIDWSKAPESCLEVGKNQWDELAWLCADGYIYHHCNGCMVNWKNPHALKRSDFDVVDIRPEEEWTGEGQPPVGIDVEIHNRSGRGVAEGAESFIGTTCKVLATFINMNGFEMVAVEDSGGSCMCFRADMCGPVRTPEQIAAEERERSIKVMLELDLYNSDIDRGVGMLSRKEFCAALYDAGYRKFEIVDEPT